MTKLILTQKVSFFTLLKRRFINIISKLVYKLYNKYYYNNIHGYEFHKPELDQYKIDDAYKYVDDGAIFDYIKEINSANIEKLSQYYPYKSIIDKENKESLKLNICNVGCFYAGADAYFLKNNPNSTVYGLDFGNLEKFNNDILSDNLKLYSGYPLNTIRDFVNEKKIFFDYAFFVRTAVKINIEQLETYIKYLSQISKNIIFLEVAKLSQSYSKRVNVSSIPINNSLKLYGGLYLHNYMELLIKYGYEIEICKIIESKYFDNSLTADHDFIYVSGVKK